MLPQTLGEDMHRVDLVVEGAVRKIERQFHDLNKGGEALTVDGGTSNHAIVSPVSHGGSCVYVVPVERYLHHFSWDEAKHPHRRPLSEIYTSIGDDIAEFGPKHSRGNVKGSPVAPHSSRYRQPFDFVEGDACLYTVTILKGQYQSGSYDQDGNFEPGTLLDYVEKFKLAAREKRFMARDFTFDPTSHATNETLVAELEVEVNRLYSGLLRWCKAHFGETFIAWMHVKAVRVFVESVLRYGLPVNFVAMLFKPKAGRDKKLRQALDKRYEHLQPPQFAAVDDSAAAAAVEYFPYVSNSFTPLSF
ncbi:hypothetical protein DYB30_002626 [Aphanomyces astaci]|uniref:V-type proton ATPase subunit C n=1 Tax=Aphanomyces astaci TaxID=112090 RepID=A0A397CBR0_APHAT|nr:hypothetical protein DYB36_000373 [Aphanomyces astaci]RHY39452.1 hypothetical protein DYB30_002626 [Aphanomyces astaci]RHY58675.1 hypothetical protein DYB38_010377 [Aphanomyces astaci]RHZ24144.1 hypothetical protein DYB26_008238 [Aphanomyces astaci]